MIRRFSCDFETTVYAGQVRTDVWAAAIVEISPKCSEEGTDGVEIFSSIESFWEYVCNIGSDVILYFHNLKFDSAFILDYLLRVKRYKQALEYDENGNASFLRDVDMPKKSVRYNMSDRGQFYQMIVREKHYIDIRDSYKLLPFSVKKIGKDFKTVHQKTEIEYEGVRHPNMLIPEHEREYIANDVLVIAEALQIFFEEGHDKLTIGSCCMSEFKKNYRTSEWRELYPRLDLMDCPIDGFKNADEYVRKSYRGGWCHLKRGCSNIVYNRGFTIDANSLYPSIMMSTSGNYFPVGSPTFWTGDYIPDEALDGYYFIRFKTKFDIKRGFLPFVQVKNNLCYRGNENLETSMIYDPVSGHYRDYIENFDGKNEEVFLTLTMTGTDFELFQKHYYIHYLEILDGCYFRKMCGMFDEYLDHYRRIKIHATGAQRSIAKLFSNNLYGKFGSNNISSFKIVDFKDDGSMRFITQFAADKPAGYIPIGSAITSYARRSTISVAQANYDKFIYSDTDSAHCIGSPDELTGVNLHPTEYNHWAVESVWGNAIFTRQKTYVEHIVQTGGNDGLVECSPYYDLKCAGMPDRCKQLFIMSMTGEYNPDELEPDELEFVKTRRDISDLKVGLVVPSKLYIKRIRGGIVLERGPFTVKQ